MAKMPRDKPRSQKLKVFRTPIGFHDAYVAAASQKAALEAWGADANIFAQGIAEEVTDPKLMEDPLARPGEVIRSVRGTHGRRLQFTDAGEPRDERLRSALAATPTRLFEQAIRLTSESRHDGDDLFSVANVAVNFLDSLGIVFLDFENRTSELEHA